MIQAQLTARRRLDDILSDRVFTIRLLGYEHTAKLLKLQKRGKNSAHVFSFGDQIKVEIAYEIWSNKSWVGTLRR